jgi:TATA-box binding protein (TBP) (component of TFIID and TFIIIB)
MVTKTQNISMSLNELNIKKLNCENNTKNINNFKSSIPYVQSEISSETCSISIDSSYLSCCKICDPKCKYLNCICDESWKDFEQTFESIKSFSSGILYESLRISTITLCFNLNTDIDTEKLSQKYVSKNNGKFYNSLTFNWHTKYQYKTVVSVKIFPNGKVQVAGLCNIKSCAYIIRKVNNKCKDFYKNETESKITNVKIAMINSDFKIINSINLVRFCDILSQNSVQSNGNFLSIVYQPIKYPAINTKFICDEYLEEYNNHIYKYSCKKKFNKTISILIFRSGSIIITGGNILHDYFNVYKYILNIIEKYNKNLFIN